MRRRAFLVGTAAITTAGCVSVEQSGDDGANGHPFADTTVTVEIEEGSDTQHDLQANAQRAFEYWEAHSETYVGFGIDFEVGSDDPDMVIAYADTPEGCEAVQGYSERVLGCAPLWQPGRTLPRPVIARVVAGARPFGKVAITTKHEIGHILGLGHDDEPHDIMSNRPEDRIPMYQLRIDIWESVVETHQHVNEQIALYQFAIDRWNAGEYAAAEPAFAETTAGFSAASEAFAAARTRADEFAGDPRVETVNLDEVRALLSRLVDRTGAIASAAERMVDAARAATEGDAETANAHLAVVNESLAELRRIEPVELRDVAIALGLVRGFDRDEQIVDVDEQPVDD